MMVDKKRNFRLTSELVPETAWFKSIREVLSRAEWDRIRKHAYAEHENKCAICGYSGRLNCHEIWEYDDVEHIQKLTGFIALCDLCHHVKHMGRANMLAEEGKLDFDKVVAHFLEVNDCNEEALDEYMDEVFQQWEERSKYKWTTDFGKYAALVESMIRMKGL